MSEATQDSKIPSSASPIRLTYVSNNVRGSTDEFDTDDLGEAMAEWARKHFKTGSPNAWLFAVVVERGDERLSREQIIDALDDMAQIETSRIAP